MPCPDITAGLAANLEMARLTITARGKQVPLTSCQNTISTSIGNADDGRQTVGALVGPERAAPCYYER